MSKKIGAAGFALRPGLFDSDLSGQGTRGYRTRCSGFLSKFFLQRCQLCRVHAMSNQIVFRGSGQVGTRQIRGVFIIRSGAYQSSIFNSSRQGHDIKKVLFFQ